ncbi:histone H3.1 [Tilletia horrida]|uniref:Histone H3.1 n=1 Tax=Tilletia horrida TaxID=155126 RepID=A0AAN6G570_9BASI|nr:histone H3.1 [Tilletia horrida]
MRIQSTAIQAIQEATEDFIVELFKDACDAAVHAKRQTVMVKDMALVPLATTTPLRMPTETEEYHEALRALTVSRLDRAFERHEVASIRSEVDALVERLVMRARDLFARLHDSEASAGDSAGAPGTIRELRRELGVLREEMASKEAAHRADMEERRREKEKAQSDRAAQDEAALGMRLEGLCRRREVDAQQTQIRQLKSDIQARQEHEAAQAATITRLQEQIEELQFQREQATADHDKETARLRRETERVRTDADSTEAELQRTSAATVAKLKDRIKMIDTQRKALHEGWTWLAGRLGFSADTDHDDGMPDQEPQVMGERVDSLLQTLERTQARLALVNRRLAERGFDPDDLGGQVRPGGRKIAAKGVEEQERDGQARASSAPPILVSACE